MPSPVRLIGGSFQDSEGSVLANGYLIMTLSQDASVPSVGNICSGVDIKITLDSNGNVAGTQSVWGNDQLAPANTFYRVTGYASSGQPAWGPNNQQVVGNGGTFDLGTWVPNQVISWSPAVTSVLLETDGVKNTSQTTLNLKSGSQVTLTPDSNGGVIIAASGGTTITLETNGTPNASQTLLNLKNGAGVSVKDGGSGDVTIQATSGLGAPTINIQNWIGGHCNTTGTEGTEYGCNVVVGGSSSALNPIPPTATEPPLRPLSIGSSSSGYVTLNTSHPNVNQCADFTLGVLRSFRTRAALSTVSQIRAWFGFIGTNQTGATLQNDDPNTASLIAFRFSTAAGDTHWKAYCANAAGASTIVDTGVSPSAGVSQEFVIYKNGSSLDYYINGVKVASISTSFPPSSNGMFAGLQGESLTGAGVSVLWSYIIGDYNL